MGKAEKRHIGRTILTWVVTTFMLGLLALGVLIGLLPALHGGKPLTILSGSMEPTFYPGDIAVVYKADSFDQVKVGDVITFMPRPDDPTLVTHRLVSWTTDSEGVKMAVTQGDANNSADSPIYEKQLRAIYQYRIPKLGYVLNWGADEFSKPWVLIVAAGVLIVYSATMLIWTSFRKSDDSNDGPKAVQPDAQEASSEPEDESEDSPTYELTDPGAATDLHEVVIDDDSITTNDLKEPESVSSR